MSRSRRKKPSLFRRLMYLVVLVTGGGAGVGGWAFQDHPRMQALWTLITGKPADATATANPTDESLLKDVVDVLKPADDFAKPGIFQVAIDKVELDASLFKPGHTVDIQARVHRHDAEGRDTVVWESKTYGERLAVAGKDELSAGWPRRPFQVEWNPGDRIVLEVYDGKPGLFAQAKRLTMASAETAPNVFPLKSGDFPLEPAQKPNPPLDPRVTHVVLESQRIGDVRSPDDSPTRVADKPIVIK